MTLKQYYHKSGMMLGSFVRALNHVTGGYLKPQKFKEMINGHRFFSEAATESLTAGAKVLVDEIIPLADSLPPINPIVVAFYNAVQRDPQTMADFEYWVAACKADPRKKLISEEILGLTLQGS